MITSVQKNKIVEYLGKQYSPKIIEHLNKKVIFNAKGEPFKTDSINSIVNGKSENEIVEHEIFKLIAAVKKRRKAQLQTRKEILKK